MRNSSDFPHPWHEITNLISSTTKTYNIPLNPHSHFTILTQFYTTRSSFNLNGELTGDRANQTSYILFRCASFHGVCPVSTANALFSNVAGKGLKTCGSCLRHAREAIRSQHTLRTSISMLCDCCQRCVVLRVVVVATESSVSVRQEPLYWSKHGVSMCVGIWKTCAPVYAAHVRIPPADRGCTCTICSHTTSQPVPLWGYGLHSEW